MNESDWQRQVIELAHLHHWTVAHFRSVRVQREDGSTYWQTPVQADGAGFPDLVLAHRERGVIFAELKADDGQLRMDQQSWIELLQASGQRAFVWRPSDFDQVASELAR